MGPVENRRGYPVIAALVISSIILVTIYYKEGQDGPLHRIQSWSIGFLSPVQRAAARVVEPISSAYEFFSGIARFRTENAALKRENSELRAKLRDLAALKRENDRLRSLLGYERRSNIKGLTAKVIGWQLTNWQSAIVVDLGERDGVEKGMPVVSGEGLVGQVVQTSSRASRVLLITDQKSGVSVQLSGSGDFGVLRGQSDGSLIATYISKDTTVTAGESVVTSGLGGVFPRGLYVGKTADSGKVGYNMYKTVRVLSPVDFRRLEEVLIVTSLPEKAPFGE